MTTVTLEKAQRDLAVLVKRALAGEEIVIEASKVAAVRLAPIASASDQAMPPGASYRGRGALKGQLVVGPEFFEPLNDEESGIANVLEPTDDARCHPRACPEDPAHRKRRSKRLDGWSGQARP